MTDNNIFDIDALSNEVDAELAEQAKIDEPNTEVTPPEVEPPEGDIFEGGEETPPVVEGEEPAPTTEPDAHLATDEHKRNEAFKQMRLDRDKNSASDKFLEELAVSYGVTKEALMEEFKTKKDEEQAKESGMTTAQYQEMSALKREVEELKFSRIEEVFNDKSEALKTKYNLDNEGLKDFVLSGVERGFDLLHKPELLDDVYKIMNYDKAIAKDRQDQLAEQKRRRETSPSAHLGVAGGAPEVDMNKQMNEEIDAYLKDIT